MVLIRKMRSRSELLLLGSSILNRLFLTAKPHHAIKTPKNPFPAGRRSSPFFRSSRVCQPCFLMKTCSLMSAIFVSSVFLESFMSCMSSERPVSMVRTFEHPNSRTSYFLCVVLLPGAIVAANCSDNYIPYASEKESRLWRDSTLLSEGCPAWGRRFLFSETRGSFPTSGATPCALLYATEAVAYHR